MERARERAAAIAVLTSIPMIGQLIAGRAVRDTLFLTEYDAVYLPRVMLAAAALSLGAAISVGRLMPRFGPRVTAAGLALINGTVFVLEAALLDAAPRVVAVVAYVHVSTLGALVISAFSSIVNERFDPLYAKTVVARVGTGATLGGVLGGVLAFVLSDSADLATVLYGLGGVGVLVALGAWNIGKSTQAPRSSEDETQFGIQTIRKDAYLRKVAVTVVLLGAVGVFVDYAMKAEADARYADSAGLLSFFAVFYVVTSLSTFLLQAGVAKPLLEKIGLGGTMVVLPVAVAVSAAFGAVWTGLWTAALSRGTQTVMSSSLFRSGYELLYTPVPAMKKRATKALIDIACNRIGYAIGSVLVMAVVALAASNDAATSWVLWLAVIAAVMSTWMIRQLHDGYVHELATSLRSGALVLQSDDIVDATTLHTLAKTGGAFNRRDLLESIEELERRKETDRSAANRDVSIDQLSGLVSDDPQRVLNVLLDESLSPHFAAHVIDLLGNDLYARPAYGALERMAPRITGQLVDAMLHRDSPVAVRRRIPRLLRKVDDRRAVWGLFEGLRDEEFDVRYRCGHALAELQGRDRDLDVPERLIIDTVARELAADSEQWQGRRHREAVSPDIRGEIDALLEVREDRNLEHVFTLLSLVFDRDAIILSLRALSSQDENLRGTALEYLHNVLPEPVREPLWPRLTVRSERLRVRSTSSSPEELLQSMQSLMLDRDHLQK
ncbi:MAG: Npt1/Npt2 family nucleotide transporter [Polyangiales bacterium]